jgi:hypothetical protein
MLNVLSEKQTEEVVSAPPLGSPTEFKRMDEWLTDRVSAGKKKPQAEVVTLTPVLAQLLLDRNPINRPIGRYNMETLRSDVSGDRWIFNGESIVVSDTGTLIDGQHRCSTVIETRRAIQTVIVFGPKEEARFTIDIGKPKTAANFLHMKGGVDTNNLSATIGLLIQYANTGTLVYGSVRATKTQIVEGFERFRGVEASVEAVHGATKMKLGSRSALAFCHYTFKRRAGAEAADLFMQKLIEGDGLRKGDPIYCARDRLLKLDRGARAEIRIEIVFKAWNAWRRSETLHSIRSNGKLPKVER